MESYSWIDLDTTICEPECREDRFAAIANRKSTSAAIKSRTGYSLYSRQPALGPTTTSLRQQSVASPGSLLTGKYRGPFRPSPEALTDSKKPYGISGSPKRTRKTTNRNPTSPSQSPTSPWVRSTAPTGSLAMGKTGPGGHSSRTAGTNTEVDTDLDLVISNIKKSNRLLKKSEVRGGEATLQGGSLKGGDQHTQISMTPQHTPTYIFPFAGPHLATERRWVPSGFGPFWRPSVLMSVTLSIAIMLMLAISWVCCQNAWDNKIRGAKKRARKAAAKFTGRNLSADTPARMEAVTGGVPKNVLEDATRAMDKMLARTAIIEQQQEDLRRLVETMATRQLGGIITLDQGEAEGPGPVIGFENTTHSPDKGSSTLVLRNQSKSQLQDLLQHRYSNWSNCLQQKSIRSSHQSRNREQQDPPFPDRANNKEVRFTLPSTASTAPLLGPRTPTSAPPTPASMTGSPCTDRRRTSTTTDADQRHTDTSVGSSNGTVYPPIHAMEEFMSRMEGRLLDMANAAQARQENVKTNNNENQLSHSMIT